MLIRQAQQIMLAISSYLINLLSITSNAYCKMLRFKAYIDTLKKYLSGILDYTEVTYIIFLCFKQLESISYIIKWDPTIFRWSIATPAD